MNFLFKIITKITFLGKLVEKLGSKVPIIFIFISLIFIAFYIPYEYENILEFTEKYPNDNIGFTLNLLRPIIINFIILILVVASFKAVNEQKRKLIEEEIERQKESLRLFEEARKQEDDYLASMSDRATVMKVHGDLSEEQAEKLAEGMELQVSINALVQLQNDLKLKGLDLNAAQKASLSVLSKMQKENVRDLGDKAALLTREIDLHEERNKQHAKEQKEIKESTERLKEFKGKANEVSEAFAKIQSVAASISPQLGGMVSSASNFTKGLGEAFIKGQGLGAALFMARTAAEGLLNASVQLSKILAEGVRESGLVNFEQMLYANVDATNQFGMSASETGDLLSGLSQNF